MQDLQERHPAKVRHAEQMKAGKRIGPRRIDGNDVGVLEPRQRLGLTRPGARHLEGDGSVCQMLLLGKIDPRKCPSAQLRDEPKPRNRLPGAGNEGPFARGARRGIARPPDQGVNLDHLLERARDVGEPGLVLRRRWRFPRLFFQAILLVNQGQQRLVVKLGITSTVPLDRARLMRPPAQDQISAKSAVSTGNRCSMSSGR